MDTKQIRQLLREGLPAGQAGASVVLLEEGLRPLVVRELILADERAPDETPEEVPIASRWPKGRTVHDGPPKRLQPPSETEPSRPASPERRRGESDQILERLNKEIQALKAEIAQQEEGTAQEEGIH
jgi:hypothetical protein